MEESLTRKTVKNKDIEIEYYISNQVNNKSSLILSMGIWEPAFRAFPLITRLIGTHCLVPSYRGRVGSGTPKSGFDCRDHANDLASVVENEATNNPIFMGFSKGVSYMLGYLGANPEKAKGIIIIDYPAIHSKAERGSAKFWGNRAYNGAALGEYINAQTLEGIENESTYKEFYQDLSKIKCPVWIFRGTDSESSIPSNLTDEDIVNYKASVKELEIIEFTYSGHMILDEELGKAVSQIRRILDRLDTDFKFELEQKA